MLVRSLLAGVLVGSAACAAAPPSPPSIVASRSHAAAGTIEVHVAKVDPKKGKLLVALYDRATWLDDKHNVASAEAAADRDVVTLTIPGVPAGRYAIAVLHDENGNEEMDFGLLGPSEQYGFSRDARGTLGAPSFDDAAFDFDGRGAVVSLSLD